MGKARKIYITGKERIGEVGGGHSFNANFVKCFDIVDNPKDCDIFFISSFGMIEKVSHIPFDKKVVLRVDNVLKKSRNRDMYLGTEKVTRMEALRYVAQRADAVIYQSTWSQQLLEPFLKNTKSHLIMNSVNESIFNTDVTPYPSDEDDHIFLYSRSSNHDNKQWHQAYFAYVDIQRDNPKARLWITGRFSNDNIPNNFDFFDGERWDYLGRITDPEQMAMIYRASSHFLYTYDHDACSNTLIEALMCGCEPIMYENNGGAWEIMEHFKLDGADYFKLSRMAKEYQEVFDAL